MSDAEPRTVRPQSVLQQVAKRLYLARIARAAFALLLVFSALYGALLLTGRLTGLFPSWFHPATLALPPVLALLVALLWTRKPSLEDAARHVDDRQGTKDLFLTYTLLDRSPGDYKPLVSRDAEAKATRVKPEQVVPWTGGGNRLSVAGTVLAALAVGVFFLPTFDPFGKVAEANKLEEQVEQLRKEKKATKIRKAQLAQKDVEEKNSPDVEAALDKLKMDLRKAKPAEQRVNKVRLAAHQKKMGKQWQKLGVEKLKDLFSQTSDAQKFGARDNESLKKWTRDLQQGSTESLDRELQEIKEQLERLAKTKDPLEKTELQQQLKKRLSELEDFAQESAGSKPLAAALQRAKQQLEAMKSEGMSTEALEGLSESLDLAKMELREISQSARDLKALEEALQTIQMAKKLNQDEKLDGEQCQNCSSMSDYQELYAEMMAALGYNVAEGEEPTPSSFSGPGIGEGGEAPEDDSVASDFVTEQSPTKIVPGKVLLSLKTKGLSDSGEAQLDYRQAIREVKQSAQEAIEQEEIPPGYHSGIQGYFDNLDAEE